MYRLEPLPPAGDEVLLLLEEDDGRTIEIEAVHWPHLGWTDAVTLLLVEGEVLDWRERPFRQEPRLDYAGWSRDRPQQRWSGGSSTTRDASGRAMKLNHANLCASNVAALSDIFTRHFAFEEERAGDGFAMLRGSDGFSLVLVKMSPDSSKSYPHAGHFNFHVGFIVDTPDAVRAKHAELSESGYFPGAIKSFDAGGSIWTAFYCPVGDGIDIEVTTRSPAAAAPGSGAA